MPGKSRRIPKSKRAPKKSKGRKVMTANSKSNKHLYRLVAVLRCDPAKQVASHHALNSSSCSSDGEDSGPEVGTEEELTGADRASMGGGVESGVRVRVRKSPEHNIPAPVKVLTSKVKDGIRKRSLLGQMESYVKRESILANIFSDTDSKSDGASDGDSRAEGRVKGSKGSIGAINKVALKSVNRISSDKNNDSDGRARSDSDDSDDRVRESNVEADKSVRRDGRHQSDRTGTSSNTSKGGGPDHDSELSDASVGGKGAGETDRMVTSAPSQRILKRSSSHGSTDKGPMHRPHSSGSTSSSSTSSSPSHRSPNGPANRKSPIDYLQDAVPPNSASSIPSISTNFKKFDNPLVTIDTSRRESINRKVPLQAMQMQAKQSFALGGAMTEKAQGRILGSQQMPQPQLKSNDLESHPSLESLLNKSKSPQTEKLSLNRYDALRVSREMRREKKLRRQHWMKGLKRVNDSAIGARNPTTDSTASDSSGSSGSPVNRTAVKGAESMARRGSPVERRKGEEDEASGCSLQDVEESEEQKRLRRVAACELLLLNRRTSSAPVENTVADFKVKQRAEKRKDREGDGKFTQEVKKKGRPLGSTSTKQTEVRQERKSSPLSPHSTRQSTGGKEPRNSTAGGEALRRLSQASDFRNKSVSRGYGAGISLSSLSATDLGTQPRKGNGISLSALTSGGKIRPVPAATTISTNMSDDSRNFSSTKSMRGSSSSSSSSSSNIYSKRYNDNDRSRTSNYDDSRLRKDRDRDRDRGAGSAGSSRSLGKGAHSSMSESVLV